MSVDSLKCKECASEYELGAAYFCERCFGPLEVKYDHSDLDADAAKRRIQAGSRGIWRYADFLPFKDRVVAVAIAKAQELGFTTVACASTGNLANAVAAHAAAAGLDSYVFVPANLEEQKLLATGVYGTNLVGVR